MKFNAPKLFAGILSTSISVLPVVALSFVSISVNASSAVACPGASLTQHRLSDGGQNFVIYATPGWTLTADGLAVYGSDSPIPLASLRAVATHQEVTRRTLVVILDSEGNGFVGRVTPSGIALVRSVSYDGRQVTFSPLANFVSNTRGCSPVSEAPGSW